MLLATFTSIENVEKLQNTGEYTVNVGDKGVTKKVLSETYGYAPIFCIPITDTKDALLRMAITCSFAPQRLIIFETDTFDTLNYVEWSNYLSGKSTTIKRKKSGYLEYLVPSIKLETVKKIVEISGRYISDGEDFGEGFEGLFDEQYEPNCNDDCVEFVFSERLADLLQELLSTETKLGLSDEFFNNEDDCYEFSKLMAVLVVANGNVTEDGIKKYCKFITEKSLIEY